MSAAGHVGLVISSGREVPSPVTLGGSCRRSVHDVTVQGPGLEKSGLLLDSDSIAASRLTNAAAARSQ